VKTEAGLLLGERYRLARQIAVGGMGEVWEGYDDALARPVAVKVLHSEFAGDRGFLERFRTEARNSASLSHPNIAQLFDYGEQEGSGFLVMELVVGEPLSDLLEREPVLPVRRLLPILAQTARALHAAHLAGVVHRDVKPGNILLGRGGRVKITDFGVSLARNQVNMTATGMVMGTAQYLSPEQAVGKPATPLSDLYSLGIIAYEALVGHRPFTGPTAVDIAVAHVNSPVPPLPASVDKQLAALVLRLLSKEPTARPASGEELAQLLDRMVPRTPPSGVPVLVSKHGRTPDTFATAVTSAGPTVAPPPSYPPRRTRRADEPTGRAATHRATPTTGVRIGRSGRLSWPLIALALLLIGLLGAALGRFITKADGPQDGQTRLSASVAHYPRGDALDGMITENGSAALATGPASTEAKDA
jgi:serine/threonine-protein kinase